jgi:hypothetical protein
MTRVFSLGISTVAIVALNAIAVSAAPIAPPAVPSEAASQAEQVEWRHYRFRDLSFRQRPRIKTGPRYYGYRRYRNYGGPYVYGGVGVPFAGMTNSGGPRYYRNRHYRNW